VCHVDGQNARVQQLADEVVRLRNSFAFYRWWLWEVACALQTAPEPYAPRSAYARWYRTRRFDALRGVAAPPIRPCSFCGGAHGVLYLVPPSQWHSPEDGRLRLCPLCYLQHYGSSAHWLLPKDEWPA
jgi:hypothetical protein